MYYLGLDSHGALLMNVMSTHKLGDTQKTCTR